MNCQGLSQNQAAPNPSAWSHLVPRGSPNEKTSCNPKRTPITNFPNITKLASFMKRATSRNHGSGQGFLVKSQLPYRELSGSGKDKSFLLSSCVSATQIMGPSAPGKRGKTMPALQGDAHIQLQSFKEPYFSEPQKKMRSWYRPIS